jgi:cell division protein FtsN
MKWLFSILLIANLGIFIWSYPQQRQAATTRHMPEQMGDLRLVRESPAKASDMAASTADEAGSVMPQVEKMTPPETPKESVAAHDMNPVEGEIAEPDAMVKVQSICETIGVFEKRQQAELLSVQLRALGLKPDIASESSNEQAGYWVLIPPQPTREQAIGTARELEAAGVEDLWRFTSGNLARAISLGLFRDEERAVARRDQIATLGFNPEVRPRYRELTKYWLSYQYSGESPITASKWQDFKQMFPEIETHTIDCP